MSKISLNGETCFVEARVPCFVCKKKEQDIESEYLVYLDAKGVYVPVCGKCRSGMPKSERPVVRLLGVQRTKPNIGLDWTGTRPDWG